MSKIEKMEATMFKYVSDTHNEVLKNSKYIMHNGAIHRMTEIALFEYLFMIYNNDESLMQTPYCFSRKKYKGKNDMTTEDYPPLDYITKSGIDRALQKIVTINILQNEQAKNDNMRFKEQGYKTVRKQEYHFDTLTACDFMRNCNLEILNMLFEGKEPMKTMTAGKRKKGDYGIKAAYIDFEQLLDNIDKANALSNACYVSSCFSLYKIEYTYRFIMYAEIAKFMKENNMALNTKIPDLFSTIVNRLPYEGQFSYSPFVLDYSNIIFQGFLHDSSENNDAINLYYYFARIIIKFSVIIYSNFNNKNKIKWTDDFFAEVADFLKNRCCVTGAFKKTYVGEFNTTDKITCFDYIRMLYTDSPLIDKTLLYEGREKYKKQFKEVKKIKINHKKQPKS